MSKRFFEVMVLIALAFALSSCSPKVIRPTEDRFHLLVAPNDARNRFDITFSSEDQRPLCIPVENWPDSSGRFTVENSDVSLQIDADIILSRSPLMSTYCPGGCGYHRIESMEELRGFVAYDAFGDPAQIAAAPQKRLDFDVFPIYCPGK